jgi:hypothetical protein
MFNKIYEAFSALRNKNISQEELNTLKLGIKYMPFVEGMFKDFIEKQFSNKIPELEVLNILSNLDLLDLYIYQRIFNTVVVTSFVFRKKHDNYFFLCLDYCEKSHRSLFKDDFLRYIANSIPLGDAAEMIKKNLQRR